MPKNIKGLLHGVLRRSDRQLVVPTYNGYRTAAEMRINPATIVVPTRYDTNGKLQVMTDNGWAYATEADVAVIGSATGSALIGGMLAKAERSRMLTAPIGAKCDVASNVPTRTWQIVRETSLPFDGIRVILLHGDPAALSGIKVAAAAGPDYVNDKLGNTLTWVDGTFGGSATGTLAGGTLQRPGVTASDMIPVSSVPRTDGRSGYVSYVRVYLPSAGTLPMTTHGQGNMRQFGALDREASFATYAAGDAIANRAGMALNNALGDFASAIWGIEYLVQGNVVSTMLVGDSTFQGFGNTNNPWGMNFGEYAARAMTLTDGVTAFTSANAGYQAQTSAQYIERLADLLVVCKPTAVAYEVFTPNDYAGTATAITDALISASLARVQRFLDMARTYNFVPILTTGIPAASGGAGEKNWNAASDAKRVALNNLLRDRYSKFALVADLDAVLTDGASPAGIRTEYRHAGTDPLHPNTAGHIAESVQFSSDVLLPMQSAFY